MYTNTEKEKNKTEKEEKKTNIDNYYLQLVSIKSISSKLLSILTIDSNALLFINNELPLKPVSIKNEKWDLEKRKKKNDTKIKTHK